MASPTITVAMPGVPAFLQGMTDLLQVKTGLLFTSPSLPKPSWACVPCCHHNATGLQPLVACQLEGTLGIH